MKCFEIRKCSDKERQKCYVWRSFKETPDDFENIKCWVFKNVYEEGNKDLLKKCLKCKYYELMNRNSGISSDKDDTNISVIKCEGVLNNEKTRGLSQTWEQVKEKTAFKAILDLSEVNNIYSCGLGVIVKIHQEAKTKKGLLVIVGLTGYPKAIFESTKLSRLVIMADTVSEARDIIRNETEPARKEEKPRKTVPPEERPPCFEYWNNHNPKNATACDECFHKQQKSDSPCWIVEGEIEGVSFQYINEECEECEYYKKFGYSSL